MIGEPMLTLKDNKLFFQYPTGGPIVIDSEELPIYLDNQVTYERLIIQSKYGIDICNDLIEDICEVDGNGEPRENGDFIRIVAFTWDNKPKTVYVDKKDLQIPMNKEMGKNQNYFRDAEYAIENGVDDGPCDAGLREEVRDGALSRAEIVEALTTKVCEGGMWIGSIYLDFVRKLFCIEEISESKKGVLISVAGDAIDLYEGEALDLLNDCHHSWRLFKMPHHIDDMLKKETNEEKGECFVGTKWVHKYVKISFAERITFTGKREKSDFYGAYPAIVSVYGLVIEENRESIVIAPNYSPPGKYTGESVEGAQLIPRCSIKHISEIKQEDWPGGSQIEWG